MKNTEWTAGTGFLFRPWVIAGLAVGVVALVVLATALSLPYEPATYVVPKAHLPSVRFVGAIDREWNAPTLVLSIDAKGSVWAGSEPVPNLRKRLASFRRNPRREWRGVLHSEGLSLGGTGEVIIRAHHRCRWGELRSMVVAIIEAGFPRVTLACRMGGPWRGSETYLYLRLLDAPCVPNEAEESEEEECGPGDERTPERIVLRSLDVAAAESARERLSTQRRTMQAEADVEPIIELAFPSSADAGSVFAVLECYADDWAVLRVRDLR